jgi:gamma-glutamylcyclotransferase (GGCT)/AIG2-like uncharacterized protein YtfP
MLRKLIIFLCLVLFLGTIIFLLLNFNTTYYYFAYGSNMDIDLLRNRIDNNYLFSEGYAKLENYKLVFPRGVGSVVSDETTDVYGCLYLLNKKEIEKLDVVEGYRKDRNKSENSYNREWIDVVLQNGKTLSAEIYIQTNNTDINGKPSNSYKQTLVRGASDCSLPDFYIQELEAIETK